MLTATMVVRLPDADSGMQHSIVRFNNRRLDSKRQDPERFHRREPVVIINPQNGAKVLRYAMGTPGGLSVCRDWIAIDYDGVDALGVRYKEEVSLTVRRAKLLEIYAWFWSHADLSIRIAIRMGLVGVGLGLLGLVTGVLGMIG